MASKQFEIHAKTALPTTLVVGDWYVIQKPNDRFEFYIVQPNGRSSFLKGITDAQNIRLEALTDALLVKLGEDYTRLEIDNIINNVSIQGSALLVEVKNTTLPQSSSPDISHITSKGVAWLVGGTGGTNYTQIGGSSISVTDGSMRLAYYDKTTNLWTPGLEVKLPTIKLSNRVTSSGKDGVTQEGVYKFIYGGDLTLGDTNVALYNEASTNTDRTYIFSEEFQEDSVLKTLKYFGITAGNIGLRTYSKVGNNVTMVDSKAFTIAAGTNTADISSLGLKVPKGGLWGFYWNIAVGGLPGRIGFLSASPNANFYIINGIGAGTFALPAKATGGGFGVQLTYEHTNSISKELNSFKNSINIGTDKTNQFITGLNNLVPLYNVSTNTLTLDFDDTISNKNQSVKLFGGFALDQNLYISFKAKVIEGTSPMTIILGKFVTIGASEPERYLIDVTTSEKSYLLKIKGNDSNELHLGVLAANNLGQKIEIRDIKFLTEDSLPILFDRISNVEKKVNIIPRGSFNMEGALYSLNNEYNDLLDICVLGNSIMGNDTGGVIPSRHPLTRGPMRLNQSYNIARRIYEYLSWNEPVFRRLDDIDWTKKQSWVTINNDTIFEPPYADERYHMSNSVDAEVSISVPIGYDKFGFYYRTGINCGTFKVFVNDIEVAIINCSRPTAGHTGNPYAKYIIRNLSLTSADIIKIVKVGATTDYIYIWGGFYWTGSTLLVTNIAHGGHTTRDLLNNHIKDELLENVFSAYIIENTIMNEAGRMADSGNTIDAIITATKELLEYVKDKDVIFMSTHPYGIDPRDGNPNFAVNYPKLIEAKDAMKKVVYDYGKSYIDMLPIYLQMLDAKGYNFSSGQAGYDFTWDGMHQNAFGMKVMWQIIKTFLKNIPLKNN